jgi:hypothetical protein
MACPECEKWFWAGTGVEVDRLFEVCETSIINPSRCHAEIRELLNSAGTGFPAAAGGIQRDL